MFRKPVIKVYRVEGQSFEGQDHCYIARCTSRHFDIIDRGKTANGVVNHLLAIFRSLKMSWNRKNYY
ncbi:MAG: hypothetical protein CEN90_401 [Parcubacteria group bacterium Licking1014_17]|nr:MAG: hypothetical protein CEN90_401 [Parcubacteria group bacterium Licking1014_17]